MRALLVLLMLTFAGCAAPADVTTVAETPLRVYFFDEPGVDWFSGTQGYLMRVSNPGDVNKTYTVRTPGMEAGRMGPATYEGWLAVEGSAPADGSDWIDHAWPESTDTLAPGESRLWLMEFERTSVMHRYDVHVISDDWVYQWQDVRRTAMGGPAVEPDQHVMTYTVGVWVNGTSFYTNNAAFHGDPEFPRGYAAEDFGGDPLPIYVYDEDRSEQPNKSKDTCHFTTITGYNALLKTQTVGGTGVRYLAPEEGYTLEGNEDHFLYGEPLIFLNRVVSMSDVPDDVPNPTDACFDINRRTPDQVPDIPLN